MAMKKNNAGVPRSKAAGRSTPSKSSPKKAPGFPAPPSREKPIGVFFDDWNYKMHEFYFATDDSPPNVYRVKWRDEQGRLCTSWPQKRCVFHYADSALRIEGGTPQPKARSKAGKPDGPKAGTPKKK